MLETVLDTNNGFSYFNNAIYCIKEKSLVKQK